MFAAYFSPPGVNSQTKFNITALEGKSTEFIPVSQDTESNLTWRQARVHGDILINGYKSQPLPTGGAERGGGEIHF